MLALLAADWDARRAAAAFFEPRRRVSVSSPEVHGITPFVLPPREIDPSLVEKGSAAAGTEEKKEQQEGTVPHDREPAPRGSRASTCSTASSSSAASVDSQTPFVYHIH